MNDPRLDKFLQRIDALLKTLAEQRNNLLVNSEVEQFYYMQKRIELQLLEERVREAALRLEFFEQRFEHEYRQVYWRWRRDVRWLNSVRGTTVSSSKIFRGT